MAIKKAQKLMSDRRGQRFKPYQIDDKVWLEATNLTTTHPTSKLLPKWYRPFKITDVISNVVYKLELPPQWKIVTDLTSDLTYDAYLFPFSFLP
ncbi:MAG TPA: hypothetical protein VEP90_19370, partial [Methylomirabilota bacterium]|nr:hypothetical protein [Methylomirabilota bacterium]